jgi:exonuclease VII large subunit
LKRGYALVTKDGRGVRAAADLVQGDAVAVVFARGRARARVEAVEPGPADGGGS